MHNFPIIALIFLIRNNIRLENGILNQIKMKKEPNGDSSVYRRRGRDDGAADI